MERNKRLAAFRANIWKLKLIRMFFWMHFFAAILIPFFTDWGGLDLKKIFLLNSWFMFWNFVLEVPTGAVADFLGRKVSLILGCAIAGIAALVYVSQPSFYIFLLAEFISAIAYTLHSGADEALAYDSLKATGTEAKSKAVLSAMESFKLGGIIVATISGGFIAAKFGLAAPMKAYAIPACIALFIALSLKEPPTGEPRHKKRAYLSLLKEGFLFFSGNRTLLILSIELALTNAFAWSVIWLFQPLLLKAGMKIEYFGIIHALSALGQIVLLSNIERAESLIGSKKNLLLAMGALGGVAFVCLAFVHSILAVSIGIILAFTFSLPRLPVFTSYMNKYIPSDKRATVLSITSMCRTLAIVVINPVIGVMADWSLAATMFVLGALMLLVTLCSRIEERQLID